MRWIADLVYFLLFILILYICAINGSLGFTLYSLESFLGMNTGAHVKK